MASQITDNFESYGTGELNGAGSWVVGAGNGLWEVESSVVKTGVRAVFNTTANSNNGYRTFTGVAAGTQVAYMYHNNASANKQMQLGIFDTTPADTGTTFGKNDGAGGCIGCVILKWLAASSNISARITDQVTAEPDITTGLAVATWYKAEIEWSLLQSTFGSIRGRINDGTWSSWFDLPVGNTFVTISALALGCGSMTANTAAFDELGEPVVAGATSNFLLMGV